MLTRRKIKRRSEAARARANARWEKFRASASAREMSEDDIRARALADRKGHIFRELTISKTDGASVTLQIYHSKKGRTDQFDLHHGGRCIAGPCGLSEIFDRIRSAAVRAS